MSDEIKLVQMRANERTNYYVYFSLEDWESSPRPHYAISDDRQLMYLTRDQAEHLIKNWNGEGEIETVEAKLTWQWEKYRNGRLRRMKMVFVYAAYANLDVRPSERTFDPKRAKAALEEIKATWKVYGTRYLSEADEASLSTAWDDEQARRRKNSVLDANKKLD